MSEASNEFSDLDRTVPGPDGRLHELVADVGCGSSGWSILWGKGKQARIPIMAVLVRGEHVHSEPAVDRQDAERILVGLEQLIRSGRFSADGYSALCLVNQSHDDYVQVLGLFRYGGSRVPTAPGRHLVVTSRFEQAPKNPCGCASAWVPTDL